MCDLETSRMGAPYIYDISSLRVNDLTLILLTWRKWLAPNNASRQQMGFNSGFKGLNGLVRFAQRRNLVSARVPSHFKRSLPIRVQIKKLYVARSSKASHRA